LVGLVSDKIRGPETQEQKYKKEQKDRIKVQLHLIYKTKIMEALVDRTDIVDGALVKAVTAALPGESIERVLDETRRILIQRGLNYVRSEMNVASKDLIRIGYSPEDVKKIMDMFFLEPEKATQVAPPNSIPPRCLCFRWRR
jgi:hypothetical protein